ncbi:hypothetical protein BLA29_001739 [Euroglyphus maynei]|uniref:Uncharacterized protein n=1 Tax=Euroglyphus maynei TaxID=6958 RepID=A0A1Y3B5K5_EURMA|nr:hypothetical protein BLA29_001739 [Euroglyphus maynei]
MFFISPVIYTNGINSHVAKFPHYNQMGSNMIMNWLARIQWQQNHLRSSKSSNVESRPLVIVQDVIKTNLFVQTMNDNRFGISCGQKVFMS